MKRMKRMTAVAALLALTLSIALIAGFGRTEADSAAQEPEIYSVSVAPNIRMNYDPAVAQAEEKAIVALDRSWKIYNVRFLAGNVFPADDFTTERARVYQCRSEAAQIDGYRAEKTVYSENGKHYVSYIVMLDGDAVRSFGSSRIAISAAVTDLQRIPQMEACIATMQTV